MRFCVTWEEIEHEGPGIYDEAYLANLRKRILAEEKENQKVYIDPHQGVYGAPVWAMEKLGINVDMADSGVTIQRYIASTMSTLFFAGKTYAPDLRIDGENIQDWLQNHCIAAFRHAQRRLKNCAGINWTVMNEPHEGFIGCSNLETGNPSPWELIKAASVFNEGYSCPWKQAGVWQQDAAQEPKLLRSDYFNNYQGRRPVFADDFLKPFTEKFKSTLKIQ
jgi:hypothetical protein